MKDNSVLLKTKGAKEVYWDLDILQENQRIQIEKDENGNFQLYVVTLTEKEI